jgi:hypothetical protein
MGRKDKALSFLGQTGIARSSLWTWGGEIARAAELGSSEGRCGILEKHGTSFSRALCRLQHQFQVIVSKELNLPLLKARSWCMPVIIGYGSLKQDGCEFEASLGYIVKPQSQKNKRIN